MDNTSYSKPISNQIDAVRAAINRHKKYFYGHSALALGLATIVCTNYLLGEQSLAELLNSPSGFALIFSASSAFGAVGSFKDMKFREQELASLTFR